MPFSPGSKCDLVLRSKCDLVLDVNATCSWTHAPRLTFACMAWPIWQGVTTGLSLVLNFLDGDFACIAMLRKIYNSLIFDIDLFN